MAHPFGVDPLGRDVLARVVYGARVSLQVALLANGIAVVIGVSLGLLAGFFGGWPDTLISRGMDALLAFPLLGWRSASPRPARSAAGARAA